MWFFWLVFGGLTLLFIALGSVLAFFTALPILLYVVMYRVVRNNVRSALRPKYNTVPNPKLLTHR